MGEEEGSGSGGENLAEQLAKLLQNLQTQPQTPSIPQTINLSTKLDHNNYPLWARLIRMAIGARGKLSHVSGIPEPPAKGSALHAKWEQDDLAVCSWILENMEPSIMVNFAEYPSAKELWDSLAATYSQGSGGIQLYELNVKANVARQGSESIEDFYSRLQQLWREIEARQPNPMTCTSDINTFNRLRAESKLYQFLAGIGEEYEAERHDLLKQEPLPTPEAAYAAVRRERDRKVALGVVKKEPSPAIKASEGGIGSGMAASSQEAQPYQHSENHSGQGLLTARPRLSTGKAVLRHGGSGKEVTDRNRLQCTNCGKPRHTREECYFLVGFPEGWNPKNTNTTARAMETGSSGGKRIGKAQSAAAMKGNRVENPNFLVTEDETSAAEKGKGVKNPNTIYPSQMTGDKWTKGNRFSLLSENGEEFNSHGVCCAVQEPNISSQWILDSGATDTI